MDRKELLDFILGKRTDGNRKSCLRIAIEGARLISYPQSPWNRDYSINKDKYETVIGAEAFTKFMEEEVLANIEKAYYEGNLDFQSDLEIDEILCRFTIIDEK